MNNDKESKIYGWQRWRDGGGPWRMRVRSDGWWKVEEGMNFMKWRHERWLAMRAVESLKGEAKEQSIWRRRARTISRFWSRRKQLTRPSNIEGRRKLDESNRWKGTIYTVEAWDDGRVQIRDNCIVQSRNENRNREREDRWIMYIKDRRWSNSESNRW